MKRNSVNPNGQYCPIILQQPTIIKDYNSGMGGTDLMDQRCCYYRISHKTTKWQHRLIFHFLTVTVVNSFILWKGPITLTNARKDVRQLDYMIQLMKEFAGQGGVAVQPAQDVVPVQVTGQKRTKAWLKDESRLNHSHTPVMKNSAEFRKRCVACSRDKISSYCVECEAFVCIRGEGQYNCWWRFHHLQDFHQK